MAKIFTIAILFIALFTLKSYARNYDFNAEVAFSFAKAYFEENNYADAKTELKKCLTLDPNHSEARKLLKLCDKGTSPPPAKDKVIEAALDEAAKKLKPQARTKPKQTGPEKETRKPQKTAEQSFGLEPPIQKGAWTLKQGELYAESYTKYYWHNHQFTNGRKKKRWAYDGKGNEIRTELKFEYGLTDRYTLMLYTAAKEAHWKDSFKSATKKGFAEIWPGVKYLLFTEPFIGSLQTRLKFPLNYSEEAVPALGTHQIDAEIKLLTAQAWPELPGYTKFELGFRGRKEEPSNEIPYFFEFGYNLLPNLILKTTLDAQVGIGGGKNEDWTKGTIGPIFKLGDLFNLEFGYGITFAGRNTSAAKEIFATASRTW